MPMSCQNSFSLHVYCLGGDHEGCDKRVGSSQCARSKQQVHVQGSISGTCVGLNIQGPNIRYLGTCATYSLVPFSSNKCDESNDLQRCPKLNAALFQSTFQEKFEEIALRLYCVYGFTFCQDFIVSCSLFRLCCVGYIFRVTFCGVNFL